MELIGDALSGDVKELEIIRAEAKLIEKRKEMMNQEGKGDMNESST